MSDAYWFAHLVMFGSLMGAICVAARLRVPARMPLRIFSVGGIAVWLWLLLWMSGGSPEREAGIDPVPWMVGALAFSAISILVEALLHVRTSRLPRAHVVS